MTIDVENLIDSQHYEITGNKRAKHEERGREREIMEEGGREMEGEGGQT